MQNRPILRKLIPIILILGLIWGVFFISRSVLQEPEYSNLDFLPEYAGWSAQVNVRELLNKGVSSIIFEEGDSEIKDLLQDFANNQNGRFQDLTSYGIQINSSILFFGLENNSILGASINLSDAQKFNDNFSKELPSQFACYGEGNVGIILYSKERNYSVKKLLSRAKKILSQPRIGQSNSEFDLTINLLPENDFFEDFVDGTINVQLTGKKIILNGELDSFVFLEPIKMSSIKSDGLHLDLANISKLMSDSILNSLNLDLPQLTSLSINYFGAELITEPKMEIELNLNGIFTLKEPLTANNQHDSLSSKRFASIQKQGYKVHIIDQNIIYIGRDKFQKTMLETSSSYLRILGSPSSLTELKGEGLTRKLIGIIPLFKASEKLSHSIKNIDIEVKVVNNDKAKIKGVITFDDEKYAINELLKFILISQQ